MECTCRKWSISGLPCCHALFAMKFLNLKWEDFIAHWFRKSMYEETYNSVVYPIMVSNCGKLPNILMSCPQSKELCLEDLKRKEDWNLGSWKRMRPHYEKEEFAKGGLCAGKLVITKLLVLKNLCHHQVNHLCHHKHQAHHNKLDHQHHQAHQCKTPEKLD